MTFRIAQEPDAIPGRPIALVVVAATVASVLAVWYASSLAAPWNVRGHGHIVSTEAFARQGVLEQSLIAHAERSAVLRREAEARLSSYGWVDHGHGIVHVPIDRAIDLYVYTEMGKP